MTFGREGNGRMSRNWRLVPLEPTDEMRDATWEMPFPAANKDVYRAMLAASPPPSDELIERWSRFLAVRLAKQENGEHYEGFESGHLIRAELYVRIVLAAINGERG